MSKLEQAFFYVSAVWLVGGCARSLMWLGAATGEFGSWPFEVSTGVVTGLVLFGWLGLFPAATTWRGRARIIVGTLALPGALFLLGSFVEELPLFFSGRAHGPSIAATYLLSPFVYGWAYYRLSRGEFKRAAVV